MQGFTACTNKICESINLLQKNKNVKAISIKIWEDCDTDILLMLLFVQFMVYNAVFIFYTISDKINYLYYIVYSHYHGKSIQLTSRNSIV